MKTDSVRKQKVISDTTYHSLFSNIHTITIFFQNLSECRSGQFTCDNGNCVSNDVLCDNVNDCEDDSDESEETCRKYLKILTTTYIPCFFN